MPDEPLAHVLRAALPWRDGPVLTECGKHPDAGMTVMSVIEFIAMVKKLGQQRASLQTCITCWTTACRHKVTSWGADPVGVVAREVSWARTMRPGVVRDDPSARLFRDELVAIAELIARHPEEFGNLLAGLAEAPRLADARRRKRRRAS